MVLNRFIASVLDERVVTVLIERHLVFMHFLDFFECIKIVNFSHKAVDLTIILNKILTFK